jgi:glycine cleavage system H lipoate-binding protein
MFPLKTLVIAAVLAAVLVNLMPDEQAMETGRSTIRVESVQLIAPVHVPAAARAV